MLEIIKFAKKMNIGVHIEPMDGSFRPLVGRLDAIVQLTNDDNCITVNVLDTMSDSDVELLIDDAIRRLTYKGANV